MMLPFSSCIFIFVQLLSFATSWTPPSYPGWTLLWQDQFDKSTGSIAVKWNVITGYLGINSEEEVYTNSEQNLQLSDNKTLQITPLRQGSWTSGRVESKYTLLPAASRSTIVEGLIRFGDNPASQKQGIWPAFFLLGNSSREVGGAKWPACGEIDIMETINGLFQGYGTAHCGQYPGGACNEPNGLGSSKALPDMSWHSWRVKWDLTPSNWEQESITWYSDDFNTPYYKITGADIKDQGVWNTLAHNGMYLVINVAVGGDWARHSTDATLGGPGSRMEIAYVAVYQR